MTFDSADPIAHSAFWVEALHDVPAPPPRGFDSWDPPEERDSTLEAERERLKALGARLTRRLESDGVDALCLVMADPEGNEFCLD